jgi:hypothetical protein
MGVRGRTAAVCLLLLTPALAAHAAPVYTLTDLGSGLVTDDLRIVATGTPFIQNFAPYRVGAFYANEINSSGLAIGTRGTFSGDFRKLLTATRHLCRPDPLAIKRGPFIRTPKSPWDCHAVPNHKQR